MGDCPIGSGKRIRHFGLLAPAAKTEGLTSASALLAVPAANPVATEQAGEFMRRVAAIDIERCPHCAATLGGRWRVVGCVPARRAGMNPPTAAPPAQGNAAPPCRGPL